MRMFRSFKNPVTKSGRTSNTTGSRIRSSARTLRENTVNLVQAARAKAAASQPGRGYTDATANRKNQASADYAGENARKKAYNAGAGNFGRRQAKYSAMKSATPPSGEGVGYRAGYTIGRNVAASRYKSGLTQAASRQVETPRPHIQGGSYTRSVKVSRTGLENRTARRASLVAKSAVRTTQSEVIRAGTVAKQAGRELAGIARVGGGQVARAAEKVYRGGQRVTLGTQDAIAGVGRGFKYAAQGNYQTAKYSTMNALNAAKYGRSRLDRLATPIVDRVEKGLDLVARGGGAAILAAGRGVSRVAGAATNVYKNRQYGKMRQAWSAANPPTAPKASVFYGRGQKTPTGRNQVAAGVRYQAAMTKKQSVQQPMPSASGQPKQLSKIAQARLANARQMKQKGYTKQQIIQANRARQTGTAFTQKPHQGAMWGSRPAPNWSSYQPAASQPQPSPSAAPQPSKTKRGPTLIPVKGSNFYSAAVQKVRASRSAVQATSRTDIVSTLRNDPEYLSPIVPRGKSASASPRPEPKPSGPAVSQALIPDAVEAVSEPKRGRGRPKATPEQAEAARIRKNQARAERRKRTGK